jgi:hypothetical protein
MVLPASALQGAKQMVRDDFIALCAGSLMAATWAGYGWFITPEPVESKLAKVRINALLIRNVPCRRASTSSNALS